MKNISLLLVVLMSGSLFAGIRATTPTPQSTDPSSWWCQRFESKCETLKEKGAPLLLIGDDVTEMWEQNGKGMQPFRAYLQKEPMNAVDIGYTGDRTENVLWRLQNGELDGYEQPKAALIMVGANNTLDFSEDEEPPCDTILGIRSIIDTIKERCPDTKIFVFSLLPCGRTPDDQRRTRNFNVNAALSRLCEPLGATYYEINSQVMDIDGNFGEDFSYDGLHLNTKGYKVWVKNITKLIDPIFFPEETPSYKLPVSRFGEEWWYERVFEIRSSIGTTTTRPNVILLGDDLAKGWEEQGAEAAKEAFGSRRVNNAGIEGDALAQIIWRARYSCLSAFRPDPSATAEVRPGSVQFLLQVSDPLVFRGGIDNDALLAGSGFRFLPGGLAAALRGNGGFLPAGGLLRGELFRRFFRHEGIEFALAELRQRAERLDLVRARTVLADLPVADGERSHVEQLRKRFLGDGVFLAELRDGLRGETRFAAFCVLSGGVLLLFGSGNGGGNSLFLF